MEIRSYEPYHVGIKLGPNMPVSTLRENILPGLKSAGFSTLSGGIGGGGIEVLATDSENRIELNHPLAALNTVGTDPRSVTETFDKLLKAINSLDYEMKSISTFVDVLTNVFVKISGNPAELIGNSVSADISSWREISGDAAVDGIRIQFLDDESPGNSLQVFVVPSPRSPSTQIILTIKYVAREAGLIRDFGSKLEDRVKKFVSKLEAS